MKPKVFDGSSENVEILRSGFSSQFDGDKPGDEEAELSDEGWAFELCGDDEPELFDDWVVFGLGEVADFEEFWAVAALKPGGGGGLLSC